MKRLHLICNAHLDPVWMWNFDEGMAACLATFYSAAELADEFDYIFCHNETLLYEYVERHDPALFGRIQMLVKQGKWHIMGGWYLQPDCNMPSGESFVRQILAGRDYFKEKFGVTPTTAINFDSFGHTRGLVQILRKCGYDSYLICRPTPSDMKLEHNIFNWVGYDGSRVKVCRVADDFMYCTAHSLAKKFIPMKAECWKDENAGVALWGVGNHGGGPSRVDLKDVAELIKTTTEYEMVHSTPERFFAELDPETDDDRSFACLRGCYSSMSSIKQKHAELENKLYMTEKLCALAALNGRVTYDFAAFDKAQRDLLTVEFHDILSGTCGPDGEKSALRKADHGLELLDELFTAAFFSLTRNYPKAGAGEYPLFVFNSRPYACRTIVEAEFLIQDALVSDTEAYAVTVRKDGRVVPSQVVKELTNINYDRRKRVAFVGELNPMNVTRYDIMIGKTAKQPPKAQPSGDIVFNDGRKKIVVGRKTGLLESYIVDGKEYLAGGAFRPVVYDDNADPWGWGVVGLGSNPEPAELVQDESGVFKGLESVRVIEDGEILTEAEALFGYHDSRFRLDYKLYKGLPYIDVHMDVFWNEQQKALKIRIPTAAQGDFLAQTAYGTETYKKDGQECVVQRYIAIKDEDRAVTLYNSGVYAASAMESAENNTGDNAKGVALCMTLLRGAAYCAHPIDDRPLIRTDRFIPFIEQGRRSFDFRFAVNDSRYCENLSAEFNEKPYVLNVFPHGDGNTAADGVRLDNKAIVLSAFRKSRDGRYVLRLFNNNPRGEACILNLMGYELALSFNRYEVKTVSWRDGTLTEEKTIL